MFIHLWYSERYYDKKQAKLAKEFLTDVQTTLADKFKIYERHKTEVILDNSFEDNRPSWKVFSRFTIGEK